MIPETIGAMLTKEARETAKKAAELTRTPQAEEAFMSGVRFEIKLLQTAVKNTPRPTGNDTVSVELENHRSRIDEAAQQYARQFPEALYHLMGGVFAAGAIFAYSKSQQAIVLIRSARKAQNN